MRSFSLSETTVSLGLCRSTRESSGWKQQFYSNHFDEGAGSLQESRTALLAQHSAVRVDQSSVGRHPLTPEFFPQIIRSAVARMP